MKDTPNKQPMAIRLSANARRLLERLAAAEEVTLTQVIESAIREYARKRKTVIDAAEAPSEN